MRAVTVAGVLALAACGGMSDEEYARKRAEVTEEIRTRPAPPDPMREEIAYGLRKYGAQAIGSVLSLKSKECNPLTAVTLAENSENAYEAGFRKIQCIDGEYMVEIELQPGGRYKPPTDNLKELQQRRQRTTAEELADVDRLADPFRSAILAEDRKAKIAVLRGAPGNDQLTITSSRCTRRWLASVVAKIRAELVTKDWYSVACYDGRGEYVDSVQLRDFRPTH